MSKANKAKICKNEQMFGDIINEKPNKLPRDIPKSACQACDLHLLQEDLKEMSNNVFDSLNPLPLCYLCP